MKKAISEKQVKEKKTKKAKFDIWSKCRQDVSKCVIRTIVLTITLAVILMVLFLFLGNIGIWLVVRNQKDIDSFGPFFYLIPTILYWVYAFFLLITIILNVMYLRGKNYNKTLLAIINMIFVLIIPGAVLLFLPVKKPIQIVEKEQLTNDKKTVEEFQGHATVIEEVTNKQT